MEIPLEGLSQFISAETMSKGAQYFYDGQIKNIEHNGRKLSATASGSEEYALQLEIVNNIILSHHCSCPIDNAQFCKHKAGLIIYLQEKMLEEMNDKREIHKK